MVKEIHKLEDELESEDLKNQLDTFEIAISQITGGMTT